MPDTLADKLNPQKYGYNAMMTCIVGAVIGYDYGIQHPTLGRVERLTIAASGDVLADAHGHQHSLGSHVEMIAFLRRLLADARATDQERQEFERRFKEHVQDWRV